MAGGKVSDNTFEKASIVGFERGLAVVYVYNNVLASDFVIWSFRWRDFCRRLGRFV